MGGVRRFIEEVLGRGDAFANLSLREGDVAQRGLADLRHRVELLLGGFERGGEFARRRVEGVVAGLAMLAAEGTSMLRNVYSITRGYEEIAERLNAIGADIERVND